MCTRVLHALDGASGGVDPVVAKATLSRMMDTMAEIKEKFFMKTNPSIPPTVTCKRTATLLEELMSQGTWEGFDEALARFQSDVDTLVQKAKMEGTTIT
jgi:hypothetical protein